MLLVHQPSLTRLYRGNYHSDVFMDLVPRKEYPDYYQIIKKPISFNIILVRELAFSLVLVLTVCGPEAY